MDHATILGSNILLNDEEVLALEAIGDVIRRPRGHVLMREGERTNFALMIRKGYVQIQVGDRDRVVAIVGPGEIVGELAAIRNGPRTATVVSIHDVEALYIAGEKWLEFLDSNPRVNRAVTAMLADRLDATNRKKVESDLSVEQRLAKVFLELENKGLASASDEGAELHFSQLQLASLAGASRESVVQVIRTFKGKGIVTTGNRTVTLLDLNMLRKIAKGDQTASSLS